MVSILYVFHCSTIGGGSYCLLNILKALDRSKYNPIVLLAKKGPLVEEINNLNIPVNFLNSLDSIPYNLPIFSIDVIRRYRNINKSITEYQRIINEIKPDIVYINSMMLSPYLKASKEAGFKTIIHIREHWPLNENKFQLARVQKFVQKYADKVVAINKFSSKQVPYCDSKTTIVYDWIDFNDRYKEIPFQDIFHEDLSDKKVILFTGGHAQNKGALDVVSLFSKRFCDTNLRLLILGEDKTVYGKTIKDKVKIFLSKIGIRRYYGYELNKLINKDKRIVCIPNIYELQHIMEQCFCLVSYFKIPHANLALAESIILKTVAVAAETEESQEYSNGGRLAFLFKMNNPDEFVDAVNNVFVHYTSMKERLKAESNTIALLFDKNNNIAQLNTVYESLIENKEFI